MKIAEDILDARNRPELKNFPDILPTPIDQPSTETTEKQYRFLGDYNGKKRLLIGKNLTELHNDAGIRYDGLGEQCEF